MRYFIDTEFDGYRGPLISMALIREDGRGLYFVLVGADEAARDPWVITNVLPILTDCPEAPHVLTRLAASMAVAGFMEGDEGPVIVADWIADVEHFCSLMAEGSKWWDQAGPMNLLPSFRIEVKRIDAYPTTLTNAVQHCAWWDALALRQKVLEMEEVAGQPAPGAASEDGPRVGDVVALMSGGAPMTVTHAEEVMGPYHDMVRVAWMTEAGDMNETELPVDALRLRRSA